MTSVRDPNLGTVLGDRYSITTRLARGGMATVYRAVDNRLTRTVAVKVMHVGLGHDEEFTRRFDREARAAARLSHPNVVSVFDQGQDDGRPYLVMEYVEGETLRDVVSREAPLTPLRALEVIEPVLGALAAAHEAGLVHRDVKPENVLISEQGQIKVADFGLAKAISTQTSTATEGLLLGTVSYLPPELVVTGRADARSDVYSAGVVLFELLTGTKPHIGDTPIQVAYAHVHADVPPPSTRRTAGPIPPYLDALIAAATARDPEARPADARVLLSWVRRVRAALRDGAPDDPELTRNLQRLADTAPQLDLADVEITQQVVPPPFPDAYSEGPPAVVHAPPPVPSPQGSRPHPLSAARLEEHRRRRAQARRRGWLVLLLVLLLATGATLAGWYLTEGRFTTAPALASLPRTEAATVADRAGLEVRFVPGYSETAEAGTVISTDPGPGTKVVDGGRMDAVVSQGPERFAVPALIGLSRGDAARALAAASLDLGQVSKRYSKDAARGVVLSASPAAGSPRKRGTPVAITTSAGPRPIPIKDYVGSSTAAAKRALDRAGFSVSVSTKHSSSVPRGRVIAQTPDSGTGARNDAIKLTSSRGPVMVTVPNVRAMGVRAATDVMRKAGFEVAIKRAAVNYLGLGYVAGTDPGARRSVPRGSTITLILV